MWNYQRVFLDFLNSPRLLDVIPSKEMDILAWWNPDGLRPSASPFHLSTFPPAFFQPQWHHLLRVLFQMSRSGGCSFGNALNPFKSLSYSIHNCTKNGWHTLVEPFPSVLGGLQDVQDALADHPSWLVEMPAIYESTTNQRTMYALCLYFFYATPLCIKMNKQIRRYNKSMNR